MGSNSVSVVQWLMCAPSTSSIPVARFTVAGTKDISACKGLARAAHEGKTNRERVGDLDENQFADRRSRISRARVDVDQTWLVASLMTRGARRPAARNAGKAGQVRVLTRDRPRAGVGDSAASGANQLRRLRRRTTSPTMINVGPCSTASAARRGRRLSV